MTTKIENISKGIIEYIDLYKKDLSKNLDEKDLKKYIKKLVKKNLKKIVDKENIGRPKRCKSAFIFYCEDVREQVKKDIPNIKVTDIIVEQSKRWKELKENNPEKVEKYIKKAVKDKVRYESEKKEFERNKLNQEHNELQKIESGSEYESEGEIKNKAKKNIEIRYNSEDNDDDEEPIKKRNIKEEDKKKFEVTEKKDDNGFYNFYNKKFKKIKKNNPDYSDDKIADKIKKKWKKLSDEEQSKFDY